MDAPSNLPLLKSRLITRLHRKLHLQLKDQCVYPCNCCLVQNCIQQLPRIPSMCQAIESFGKINALRWPTYPEEPLSAGRRTYQPFASLFYPVLVSKSCICSFLTLQLRCMSWALRLPTALSFRAGSSV